MSSARLLLLLLPLLAACTLGPDFAPPPETAPPSYGDPGSPPPDSVPGTAAPETWWRIWRLPALEQMIETALRQNPSLKVAEARLAQAHEAAIAAGAALSPTLSVGAAEGRQRYGVALFGPTDFKIPPFNYTQAGAALSFVPDIFGGSQRSIERAEALAAYQQEQWRSVRLSLTGNVVLQALTLAGIDAETAIIDSLLADDAVRLRLTEVAFAAGDGTVTERLAAQTQLANDQALLPPLRQQRAAAGHALAILVGATPGDWSAPALALTDFSLPEAPPLTLPSALAHDRPDIRAAEAQWRAASAAVGMAQADRYPQIALSASATLESLQPQNLFQPANAANTLLASVSQTVLDGSALAARERAAGAALSEQQAIYQEVVLNAFAEVGDALRALQNDRDERAARQSALDSAQQAAELAERRYSVGDGTLPRIIAERRAARQARLDLVRLQRQALIDRTLLILRLGGVVPTASGI